MRFDERNVLCVECGEATVCVKCIILSGLLASFVLERFIVVDNFMELIF